MDYEQLLEAQRVARLIIGFLNNDLSLEQREELDSWIDASNENLMLFERLTDESRIEESTRWFSDLDDRTALHNVKLRIHKTNARKRIIRIGIRSAAAALLVLLGYGAYRYYDRQQNDNVANIAVPSKADSVMHSAAAAVLVTSGGARIELSRQQQSIPAGNNVQALNKDDVLSYTPSGISVANTLEVPAGLRYQVRLSDGTAVWLNAVSLLQYPTSFNDATRTVTLEGEAYFEVAHDNKKPFFVNCKNTVVKVTGTHFNIYSYRGEPAQQVTLLQGGIELTNGRSIKKLLPNQSAEVTDLGGITVKTEPDAETSISWTKGQFSFKKTPLREVMKQVSRWYDINVQFEKNTEDLFSGNIPRSSTLQEVLRMLELSAEVHFIVRGRTVTVRP